MLWHHDSGWWALFLAVIGLLLMFPCSMAANIVTPKLQNWWAERSAASTRKRIQKLQDELATREEEYPEISEAEHYVLVGIEFIVLTFAFWFLTSSLVMLTLLDSSWNNFPPNLKNKLLGPVVLWSLMGGLSMLVSRPISRYRISASPLSRRRLRKSIETLQDSLKDR